MFSRRFVFFSVFFVLLAATLISLVLSGKHPRPVAQGAGSLTLTLVGPLQYGATKLIQGAGSLWRIYFDSVRQARENELLRKELALAREKENEYLELAMANERLRSFLNFREGEDREVLVAEIVGKDPSPWFKTFIVNRGWRDGVRTGLPVVVPDGIVGQVIEVAGKYSKVLLVTDRMSGVDSLVQRTRARGVVKGSGASFCSFSYALRRYDIAEGDVVVSSGLDGIYPKGLRIGWVDGVVRGDEGIFQDVMIQPFVDFERIEEVMILLLPDEEEADDMESQEEPLS
ncbi:rod shape-determining protein MreC [Desulfobotulus mexicanus]|uniref:Cell shape-determining protein MreC n=1 Tax=Desulfobotulus mexicanus TaxID=2586642 RepID=A0A5S5MG55_9BACT|nr:rod shape-determining protein MreC [Desulfobotulus mexicanus]TYT74595.1 rod shape-determining protein MreC [Desulfobotulus mexicanus]